jgi:hypothetical protein
VLRHLYNAVVSIQFGRVGLLSLHLEHAAHIASLTTDS